jgi:hypothetical protein
MDVKKERPTLRLLEKQDLSLAPLFRSILDSSRGM